MQSIDIFQKSVRTNLFFACFVAVLGLVLQSCGASAVSADSGRVEGTISGSDNMNVYLDYNEAGKINVLGSVQADGKGHFVFDLDSPPKMGAYRVRIGAQSVNFVLDGTENHIIF